MMTLEETVATSLASAAERTLARLGAADHIGHGSAHGRRLTPCLLVDVDNTLALMCDRGVYEHERAHEDTCDDDVAAVVRGLVTLSQRVPGNELRVIILSGRFETHREVTEDWLEHHDVPYDALLMRADGDRRPDDVVKQEIYERVIAPHHTVWLVLDDRNRVVAMWRRLGLRCLQVREGDF